MSAHPLFKVSSCSRATKLLRKPLQGARNIVAMSYYDCSYEWHGFCTMQEAACDDDNKYGGNSRITRINHNSM